MRRELKPQRDGRRALMWRDRLLLYALHPSDRVRCPIACDIDQRHHHSAGDQQHGLPGSYEALFHDAGMQNFLLPLRGNSSAKVLEEARLERAIGVIYRADTERQSHYFFASMPHQFDAVLHFDRSRAVEPLERWEIVHTEEAPETYPSAL